MSSGLDLLGVLAVACGGLFAGAAAYINIVEHPARMSCGVDVALREWEPSYQRATLMQAPLALAGGTAGVLAWIVGGGTGYLVGAVLLLAVVPFTLIVILPTNRRLHDLRARGHIGDAGRLLKRWNALHAVRTFLSIAAFGFMLFALRG